MSKRNNLWRVVLTGDNGKPCTYMVLDSTAFYALNRALMLHYKVVLDSVVVDVTITRTNERIVAVPDEN
jgi:hypothetical protein